jgi:RNA polymerase sigma-70 factor, ECF subfamily
MGDPFANPEALLRRVYAYVSYRVDNRSDAEDITSETFERALRYRDSFDDRRGDPVGWLLGIARNCIYDAKMRPRPLRAEPDDLADDGLEPEVVAKLVIAEALASLSEGDRELLALRYGAGLRPREIAGMLERRTNAVEVALSRAKARFAAALDSAEEPRAAPEPSSLRDIADSAL